MTTTQIILSNVSVQQYGKNLLSNISFKLNAGEHLAITGSSGSGKTILAKAIASQIFYKGNIEVNFLNNATHSPKIIFAESAEQWKNLSNKFIREATPLLVARIEFAYKKDKKLMNALKKRLNHAN